MNTSPNDAGDAGDQPAGEGTASGQFLGPEAAPDGAPAAAPPAGPGRIVLAATPIGKNLTSATSKPSGVG